MKRKIKIKISLLILLVIILITLCIFKSNENCANFYSRYVFAPYVEFVGNITSKVPFSIFEISFVLLIGLYIFLLVRTIKGIWNGKWLSRLLTFVLSILFLVNYYIGTAGVVYGRSDLYYDKLKKEEITPTIIEDALAYYMNEYNAIAKTLQRDENGQPLLPYSSLKELSDVINQEYENNNNLGGYAYSYNPRVKYLISSPLFLEMQITGITMGILGEANVNSKTPSGELPFTVAHEIAHTKGIYREADANQAALMVCINSSDPYLRYSALYISISSLMEAYNLTFRTPYYEKYPLCEELIKEWNYNYNYWKKHDLLGDITDKWNSFYLKLNGSKKGTGDYVDSTEKVDTGEKDDNGNTIYEITSYSPYQTYLYYLYVNK